MKKKRTSGHTEKLQDVIIEHLSDPGYKPLTRRGLAGKLGMSGKQMGDFQKAVDELIAAGKIKEGKNKRLRLKTAAAFVTGVVKKIGSGAAFVIPHETPPEMARPDIYVSARDAGDAQTGDEVLVRLISRRRSGGQRCGRIEKVLERARNVFVGTYFEAHGQGYVRIDGTEFQSDIHVGDPGAKGAKPNDKVVIEMLRFPSANQMGEGVLIEVLGHRGDPGVDTMTVVHSLGLPHEFSEAALSEARQQAANFNENDFGDRLDLTKETIVTIDPSTARDFDDAISLRKDRRGHWQLGVHIADVAHFVPRGSALDKDAYERSTSVYLPRHVIPMLPEIISNGLASLQEGQIRYTKSVFIEFDPEGNPLGAEVANSVIKVTRRFAYEEVMPIIKDPRAQKGKVQARVVQLLLNMHKLAMMLRKRRFAKGALQINVPEVEIDFDDDGNVIGAHEALHDESHEIIEEFMLAANIAIAQMLASRDIPFLRRVHGPPDELRLKNFQEFCAGLGYELKNFQSRSEIQALLRKVAGKPEERAINYALLRAMKQAEYSPEEMSHYALNEDHYCHFTSPIRRYPDLTIHRLVGSLAAGRSPRTQSLNELVQLGRHCSLCERRADKAERELTNIKLLRYLENKIGEEMDAYVTGVESFGIFCRGSDIPAEGLVHISSLVDDFYAFDPTSHTLTGQRTKKYFRLGDRVRVQIANVDVDRRQLSLRIVCKLSSEGQPESPSTGRKTAGNNKKSPSAGRQVPNPSDTGSDNRKASRPKKKSGRRRR